MTAPEWWPGLDDAVQAWLIDNNGDSIPAEIAEAIVRSGGAATPGAPLPDEDVDWIEAVANGEFPD